jgi:hypothetical protein
LSKKIVTTFNAGSSRMTHRPTFAFAEMLLSFPLDDLERVERVRLVLHVVLILVLGWILKLKKYFK